MTLVNSTVQQMKTKSYLDGLGDLVDVVQGLAEGEDKPMALWGSKFAASWVPNLIRQPFQAARGFKPERKVWGKKEEYYNRLIRRAWQGAELGAPEQLPQYDVWGDVIRYNEQGKSQATDFVWSLLSPVSAQAADNIYKVDLALV